MSNRATSFVEKEFYHIYNRGNSKQIIFKDSEDYKRFTGLLYACNSVKKLHVADIGVRKDYFDLEREETLIAIGAYVLMPNHFHILLTPLVENGVSLFMQKISTAYVMYFNKKYNRTGGLFEGKFKSQYAGEDRYLKYLFSYIHLNPIKMIDSTWKESSIQNKKEALDYLRVYNSSSYLSFLGVQRSENKILDISVFPNYFPNEQSFQKEILSWFSARQDLVE